MPLTGAEYIQSPAKRSLDVSVGIAIATAALPLSVAVGAETCLEHRTTNPFFIQKRLGKLGMEFSMYKFQSIRSHTAESLSMGGSDHPYASRAGRLIRAAGLDELPQVINVLRGDMSLVGIRPMPAEIMDVYREVVEDETLFAEWRACYGQNPGLTGEGSLYAKSFPEHESPDFVRRRMEIDIDSFHGASLASDIQILSRTPTVALQAALRQRVPVMSQPMAGLEF